MELKESINYRKESKREKERRRDEERGDRTRQTTTHLCADVGGADVERAARQRGDPVMVDSDQLLDQLHEALTINLLTQYG